MTTAMKLVTCKHCNKLQIEQENANIKGGRVFTDKNTICKYETRPAIKHRTYSSGIGNARKRKEFVLDLEGS